MANVLGELFSEIANSIRKGLGEAELMKPSVFPDKIDEIVELLKNTNTGSGDGGIGSGSVGNLKINYGTFRADADRNRKTVIHGFDTMPDFVMVQKVGLYLGDTSEYINEFPLEVAWGFQSTFSLLRYCAVGNVAGSIPIDSYGIDNVAANVRDMGYIYCPDETTFEVGAGSTSERNKLSNQSGISYCWIAISGMGAEEPILQPLTVTENGTYTPPEGVEGFSSVSVNVPTSSVDVPFTTITVTAKRAGVVVPGATVTAENGTETVTGVTGEDGKCMLKVSKSGAWSITVSKDGGTVTTSTYVSFSQYNATATLFHATITIACETGATVTLKKPDGSAITETTTSERTAFTVYSSGTYTTTVTYNGITKTETIAVSTTVGRNYLANMYVNHLNLEETSWEQISAISAEGNAANYFAVGDTKSVALNGTIGTVVVNATYYVYIIGINHNAEFEGNGIHFGCFKTSNGTDIALVDSMYGSNGGSTQYFQHGTSGSENWGDSPLRKTILGSTGIKTTVDDTAGPGTSFATTNTLMGAVPSELRSVMKPVKKYLFEYGTIQKHLCVNDYFSLLSSFEVTGSSNSYTDDANNKYSTYSKQYEYYSNGASAIKYKHNAQTTACIYWLRDRTDQTQFSSNMVIRADGAVTYKSGNLSYGVAPIFVV